MKKFYTAIVVVLVTVCGCGSHVDQSRLTGNQLLDTVQKQTLKYFTEFAHPGCGMAVERSDERSYSNDVVTTGGTGFGIMAIIAGTNRGFITRQNALAHLTRIVNFLDTCDRYHGAWSHWYYGSTGKTKPFSKKDDGGDIVETAYLIQGLLTARQYFNKATPAEEQLRKTIDQLWKGVDWNWYTHGENTLYWHWSPDYHWAMNMPIRGWNECLIAYVLAASSPTHPIDPKVYHQGWTDSDHFTNGKKYYGIQLPLGFNYGGPLFFTQYSFLGLDPRGLQDQYADYWKQNVAQTMINYTYCIENPKHFKGYGPDCWGLTSSDDPDGYSGHSPTNDNGVITPTAALSSFPYTPKQSMDALNGFFTIFGNRIWGKYGFTDAFSLQKNWYADNYLAIDQGPIVVMIENYRSQLLWNLFMSSPEVNNGLLRLGFFVDTNEKMEIEKNMSQSQTSLNLTIKKAVSVTSIVYR